MSAVEISNQDRLNLATAHLRDVQVKVKDLQAMERVLEEMIAQCADGTLPDCPLIEAFFRAAEAPARTP